MLGSAEPPGWAAYRLLPAILSIIVGNCVGLCVASRPSLRVGTYCAVQRAGKLDGSVTARTNTRSTSCHAGGVAGGMASRRGRPSLAERSGVPVGDTGTAQVDAPAEAAKGMHCWVHGLPGHPGAVARSARRMGAATAATAGPVGWPRGVRGHRRRPGGPGRSLGAGGESVAGLTAGRQRPPRRDIFAAAPPREVLSVVLTNGGRPSGVGGVVRPARCCRRRVPLRGGGGAPQVACRPPWLLRPPSWSSVSASNAGSAMRWRITALHAAQPAGPPYCRHAEHCDRRRPPRSG